jgi:hypothetical protein
MPFLQWLERLSLSTWIREGGSMWGYPTILFLHTVGLGFLAGLSVAMALRILGVASRLPLTPFEKFYPLMWAGFWVNAISGILLLMADATTKAINPVFYIKIGFTLVAVIVLIFLHRRFFNDPMLDQKPVSGKGKALAVVSLICWAGAITAGRLMAYIGPVAGLPGISNHL